MTDHGFLVFALVCGIAMSNMLGGQIDVLASFIKQLSNVMTQLTTWIIWISPVGIFFILVTQIIEMDDISALMQKLGLYTFTVTFGILFHGFVVLLALMFLCARRNPYGFLKGMGEAIIISFATACR